MAEIQHINRNSDFSVVVRFMANGIVAKVPSYPWRLIFSTDTTHGFNRYTAYFDGEGFHNCYRVSDSEVLVVLQNHQLGSGILQMALEVDLPSDIYQDGVLNAEIPSSTQIELWDKASDTAYPTAHVEAVIGNLIQGKGVPPAGTPGQVLKKKGEEDFDTEWGEDLGAKAMTDKPGLIVPATGGDQKAEIFNTALPSSGGVLPGDASHAEGINTFAGGQGSHAEGFRSISWGYASHAEGNATHAKGTQSHTEGEGTIANGSNSHAEGVGTVADGASSHAEGFHTYAQALNSHAEGEGSFVKPSAKSGHAGGTSSVVEAEAGFAHGVNAVSKNRGEAVFGKNNIPDNTGKSVFQVGIGANRNNPKTGFQIDSDGTIWIINTASGSRISLQSWLNGIQLKKVVVDTLPAIGDPSTIYMLRVTTANSDKHNYYEEYIYVNGKWELLGTSDTDETIVERILNNQTFANVLADKATQEQLSEVQQTAGQAYERADEAYTRGDDAYTRGDQAYERADQAYARGDQAYTRGDDAYVKAEAAHTRAEEAYAIANNAAINSSANANNYTSLRSDLVGTEARIADEMRTRSEEDNRIRNDYQNRDQEIYYKIADVQTSLEAGIDSTGKSISEPLTEASCSLDERVSTLEKLLVGLLSGNIIAEKLVARNLQVFGETSLIKWGEGAPVVAPDFVGQRYIDTTNKLVYTAIGNAAVADWTQQ